MKSLGLLSVCLLLLSAAITTAQTLDSALAYYPLAIGDLWQFRYRVATCTGCYLYYYTLSIESDTLMPNGKSYRVQVERRPGSTTVAYLRMDTLAANVYQYGRGTTEEFLVDSLRAQPGQRFGTNPVLTFCWSAGVDTIAGVPAAVKSFSGGIGSPVYTYACGIGLVSIYDPEGVDGFPYVSDFIYAKINDREYGTIASAREIRASLPSAFELSQNYPNPFNPTTTIRYALPASVYVRVTVVNILGQRIASLVNEVQDAGYHEVRFDAGGLASGVYFYRVIAGDFVAARKMTVAK